MKQGVQSLLDFSVGTSEDSKGLRGTINIWREFCQQRAGEKWEKMNDEVQQIIVDYIQVERCRISCTMRPTPSTSYEVGKEQYSFVQLSKNLTWFLKGIGGINA